MLTYSQDQTKQNYRDAPTHFVFFLACKDLVFLGCFAVENKNGNEDAYGTLLVNQFHFIKGEPFRDVLEATYFRFQRINN